MLQLLRVRTLTMQNLSFIWFAGQLLALTTEAVSSAVEQGPHTINVHIFIYIHYIQKYWQTAEECTPVQLSLRTVKHIEQN